MSADPKPLVTTAQVESVISPPRRGETFLGNPCKKGHAGTRYRKGGMCVECAIAYAREHKRKARQA